MTENPCILAIDTATGPCSVAVWKDGAIASYIEDTGPSMQSARLLPMVEKALAQAGIDYPHLTRIACTIGPGSFTGIRVGLSTASAIAFAAGIPGMGFTTLDVLAYGARAYVGSGHQIVAILNAGKGEWYSQGFRFTNDWKALYSPRVSSMEEIEISMRPPATVAGNASPLPTGYTATPLIFPRADVLAELAASGVAEIHALKPFYIRPPDAKPMPT